MNREHKLRPYLLALDIGSTIAKFVQISKRRRQQQFGIANSGTISLPPDAIVDGEVLQPASTATTIKTAFQKQRISTRQTAVAISSSRLILRRLDLPPLPLTQLKQLMTWELERYTPYSAQETNFALIPLEQNSKHHTVLLAAIPKSIVNPLLSTLKLANLRPLIIEPRVVALYRYIQYCYSLHEDDIIILNLETCSTDILIVSQGQPVVARTVSFNNNKFHAREILLDEIHRSLDFVQAHNNMDLRLPCFCAGTEANNKCLLHSLETNLGVVIKTVKNNSFPDIDSKLYATSIGLGLGWWGGETPCKQLGY